MDGAFWAGMGCVVGLLVPVAVTIVLLTWSTSELKAMARRLIDRK